MIIDVEFLEPTEQRGYLLAFWSLYIRAVAEITDLPRVTNVRDTSSSYPMPFQVVNHPHHNRTEPYS